MVRYKWHDVSVILFAKCNKMKKTEKVGVLCVYDNDNNLIAINKIDMVSRKHVFYKCVEMSEEEIEGLLKCDEKNIANEE